MFRVRLGLVPKNELGVCKRRLQAVTLALALTLTLTLAVATLNLTASPPRLPRRTAQLRDCLSGMIVRNGGQQ